MAGSHKKRRRGRCTAPTPNAGSGATGGSSTGKDADAGAGGQAPASVMIAIPSAGQIDAITMATVQELVRSTRRTGAVFIAWQTAQPVSRCRNLLARRFLQDKRYTHLLFVDTDMAVPPGGLDRLLESGAPLACGPAPVLEPGSVACREFRAPGIQTNIGIADADGASYRWLDFDDCPRQPFSCDVSGLSFCLIAREVLERMEPPWFTFVDLPDANAIGEDVYFFRKARDLGYRLLVDPAATCDHIKRVDLSHAEHLVGAPPPPLPRESPLVRQPSAAPPRGSAPIPRTIVVVCTRDGRLELETAECLLRWHDDDQIRAGVQLVEAADCGAALRWFLNHPAASEPSWERLLLLGRDIVPALDTLRTLASVDAPLVAALYRQLVDGELAYHFEPRDASGRPATHLTPEQCAAPFEAAMVGLECILIRRDAWSEARQAAAEDEHHSGPQGAGREPPERSCGSRLSALVRRKTARWPIVVPHLVTRRAQVGLLSLVELRRTVRARTPGDHRHESPPCTAAAR